MAGQMNFGRTDGMTGHIAGSQLTALNIARRISLFRPKAEQTMENMLTMTIVDPDIITEQIIQGSTAFNTDLVGIHLSLIVQDTLYINLIGIHPDTIALHNTLDIQTSYTNILFTGHNPLHIHGATL